MISQLKSFTINMVAGANVATVIVMLLVGFSDYVNPESHPVVSTAGLVYPVLLLINLLFVVFWVIFRKRMLVIPLLGYVLAYVPTRIYIPFNIPHDTPLGAIKVLSYNVQAYHGSDDETRDEAARRILDYIAGSWASIVCIQEDMDGGRPYIHAFLDSIYPYSERTIFGDKNGNAQGVYSKYPILNKERIEYDSKGNASFAYQLDINGKTVLLINNHFESNHLTLGDKARYKEMLKEGLNGELESDTAKKESRLIAGKLFDAVKTRAPQADAVHEYIEAHRKYPIIVCGDFNDNPISYTRRTVAKGLTDCYVSTGRGLGLSYNQKGFFVRIDNIMCSDHFQPFNCTVDSKIDASDHYPIYCWLKFGYKP